MLLELVGEGFEETKRTLDYWRNRVDPEGVRLELEEQLRRRRFEVSRRANGMVWGEFSLPALAGEIWVTRLVLLVNLAVFAGVGVAMIDVFGRVMQATEPQRGRGPIWWLVVVGAIGSELFYAFGLFQFSFHA